MLSRFGPTAYLYLAALEDESKYIISFRYIGQDNLIECLSFPVVTSCMVFLAKTSYDSVLASVLAIVQVSSSDCKQLSIRRP